MNTYQSDTELSPAVARDVVASGDARIIGIDGKDGAGKTTLAKRIANEINGTVISLDDYVEKNKGGYARYLSAEDIKARIESQSGHIILEGICLLAAAEKVGIKLDRLIYVKRFSSYGLWVDEDECASSEPVETLIKKMEESLRAFAECEIGIGGGALDSSPQTAELPDLLKEVVLYHAKYKPQGGADYVLHRIEE